MKKGIRSLSLLLSLLFVIGAFISCAEKSPPNGEDASGNSQDTTPTDLGDILTVMGEGKTDYVIVYNTKDALGKYMANELADLLMQDLAISATMRADSSVYPYEIVIGSADREESQLAKSKLSNSDDFYIGKYGNRIVVTANSVYAYQKMFQTLSRDFFDKENKTFQIHEREAYSMAEHEGSPDRKVCLFSEGRTAFTIIYAAGNKCETGVGDYLSQSLKESCGIQVEVKSDFVKYAQNQDYEILLGVGDALPDREESKGEKRQSYAATNNFIVTLSGKKILIFANSEKGLASGVEYFLSKVAENTKDGVCYFSEKDLHWDAFSSERYSVPYEKLKEIFVKYVHTYPTLYDEYIVTNVTSSEAKRDQALVNALIERLGDSMVFCVGSSSLLYQGFVRKLDPTDYQKVARDEGGKILVPSAFLKETWSLGDDVGETIELKEYAAKHLMMRYYYNSSTGIAVLSPANVHPFGDADYSEGGYTNKTYLDRMYGFFHSTALPEPGNETEQTRVVLEDSFDYPQDAVDYRGIAYHTVYSPSILAVQENGKSVLYASYEVCLTQDAIEREATTYIKRSRDGGATWETVTRVYGLKMSTFFELGGDVYFVGSQFAKGEAVSIYREDAFLTLYHLKANGGYDSVLLSCATVSDIFKVQVFDNVLYFAKNDQIVSCSLDLDIMNPDNWVVTDTHLFDLITPQWFKSVTGKNTTGNMRPIEGNVVKGPDGSIYGIYRVECHPYGNYAVMMKLSANRKTLSFLPNNKSLINLPTTVSRFVIEYDETSGYYICISNLWTMEDSGRCHRARNVLAMSVSKDLQNWKVIDTLLVDREMMTPEFSAWAHAFQYTDFDFDGDDLVLLSREAQGFANSFHDGVYATFYRVKNFRVLIEENIKK